MYYLKGALAWSDIIPDLNNGVFETSVWQSSADGSIWKHFDGYEHHDENCGCTYNVTEKTLHLTEAEVGKQIRVLVSYTDGHETDDIDKKFIQNVNDAPTGSRALPKTGPDGDYILRILMV